MKYFPLFIPLLLAASTGLTAEKTAIKIGVQASGTLAWELSVLQHSEKYKNLDFTIEAQPLANTEAGKVALQSSSVDMIVSDWIWVSRMRADGADFTFYPYSTNSGAVMVPETSSIRTLADLQGKKLGVAGGELDKNWLLLQALGQKQKLDLNATVEKVFGAPPLIDEQLKQGRIDAALNYWHFAAKLEGQGFRKLIDGKELLAQLGVKENVPVLGYVFKQSWAEAHKTVLSDFLAAGKAAKANICTSDAVWQKVIPLTQTQGIDEQTLLRRYYCEGEVKQWGKAERQAAESIYGLLRTVSNNKLTGDSAAIQPGTFWTVE